MIDVGWAVLAGLVVCTVAVLVIVHSLQVIRESAARAALAREVTDRLTAVTDRLERFAAAADGRGARMEAATAVVAAELVESQRIIEDRGDRMEAATAVVASDLAEAHQRADAVFADEGSHGQAADSFSRSAPHDEEG